MFWRGADRRKSVRVQIRMTVHVEVAGQPRFYESISRDVSLTGASVVLRRQLEPGTSLYLEFRLPESLATLYCPAQVVWSKQTGAPGEEGSEPGWIVGIEFVSPPRAVRLELKRFITQRVKDESQRTSA